MYINRPRNAYDAACEITREDAAIMVRQRNAGYRPSMYLQADIDDADQMKIFDGLHPEGRNALILSIANREDYDR